MAFDEECLLSIDDSCSSFYCRRCSGEGLLEQQFLVVVVVSAAAAVCCENSKSAAENIQEQKLRPHEP